MKKLFIPLTLLLGYVVGVRAQKQTDEPLPQILLIYNHTEPSGKLVAQAKAQPILLLRVADPDAHLAPIEPGTLMLCRPYSEGSHLMFRCGQDKFVMDAINFVPEK